jgi:hypothetical protein
VAEHDLIGNYRAALRGRLPGWSHMDDVLDEVEDHLRSTVEQLVRLGNDHETAQRLTLARFGDPSLVAHAYATTRTGGLRMPSRLTRASGYVAIAAAIAWVVAGAFAVIGQTSLITEFSAAKYFVWAALILCAALATVVALFGLLRRAGAAGDWRAWIATALLVIGVLTLGGFAWFWPAGGALLAVAALIVVLRARAAALPMGASSWLLVFAFPAGTALFLGLRYLQVGPVDEYGDYPLGFVVGIVLATLLFAAALVGLGRWLTREEPLDDRTVAV